MFEMKMTLTGHFESLGAALRAAGDIGATPGFTMNAMYMSPTPGVAPAWGARSDVLQAPVPRAAVEVPASTPLATPKPRVKKETPAQAVEQTPGKPVGDSATSTSSATAPEVTTPPLIPEPDTSGDDAAACSPGLAEVSHAAILATEPTADAIPTVDELRALVGVKISAGFRAALGAMLRTHGGDSITKLPEANRIAFKRDLEALGAAS